MGNDPIETYYIEIDNIGEGVENSYFQILDLMKSRGYQVNKTEDVFASSEMSSIWGDMARRRSEQETRAMQLMATLNGMIKDLFKIIRTITIIDERLEFYKRSNAGDSSADSTLKDIWVTLVEQGTKNPSSVIGMATQVGFVALPDYFYTTKVSTQEEIDGKVAKLDISEKLAYVLKRKLTQYLAWKERSEKELTVRGKLTRNMLKTHISQVRLYAEWLKPYLKSITKLRDIKEARPELVTAFETAWLEISLEGVKKKSDFGKYIPLIKVKFVQRTSPGEAYQSNYQRGYVHRGKVEIKLDAHLYTSEEFAEEKKKADQELLDFLVEHIDESIKTMKEDLIKVMQEDYESLYPKKKEETKKEDRKKPQEIILEIFPFLNFAFQKRDVGGVKDIFNFQQKFTDEAQKNAARKAISGTEGKIKTSPEGEGDMWKIYDAFKQSRGMARP